MEKLKYFFNTGEKLIQIDTLTIQDLYSHIMGIFQNPVTIENVSEEEYDEFLRKIKNNVSYFDKMKNSYINYANECVEYINKVRL